jgi:hypothetical protein
MWLFPNTKKWYLDSQFHIQKLGLEFPNVHAMEDLAYEELFIEDMQNSPNIQIPPIVWKGGKQGLINTYLPQC